MKQLVFAAALATIGSAWAITPEAIEELVGKMTLEEKVGQLVQFLASEDPTTPAAADASGKKGSMKVAEMLRKSEVGTLIGACGIENFNFFQKVAVEESRLHIPIMVGHDMIHGVKTQFPVPVALSCAWDEDLWERCGKLIARETPLKGCNWTFTPMVDIARDARWGRICEGAGQDSLLDGKMAAALVRGIQTKDVATPIAACLKHYVGYGASFQGRDYNAVEMSESTLRNVYLPPFKAGLDAGALTVMPAFHTLNGVPCSMNRFLLTDILRTEWGFTGFTISDWAAVAEMNKGGHGMADNDVDLSALSINAGMDQDMMSGSFKRGLLEAVKSGKVSVKTVDEAVRRVLTVKNALGLFEKPYIDAKVIEAQVDFKANAALAREAAARSCVLLKNDGTLPLKSTQKIALVGPGLGDIGHMAGAWASYFAESPVKSTMIDGFKSAKLDFTSEKVYGFKKGDVDLVALAKVTEGADVIVAVFGEHGQGSGEGHSIQRLELPEVQLKALAALKATGKPVVALLMGGRPLAVPELERDANAILLAWAPGTSGGDGVTDVLLGKVNPSGRLTTEFPRTTGQMPLYYNILPTGRPTKGCEQYRSAFIDGLYTALYPFGYGLSYSSFAYANEKVEIVGGGEGGERCVVLSCEVTNTGKVAGVETVQAYTRQRIGIESRPIRELRGWQRVHLEPGETKTVEIVVPVADLAYWVKGTKVAASGRIEAWICKDSTSGKALSFLPFAVLADSPKANPDSCVIVGKARFTVLTDRMIRMEYAPDDVFEDRASFTFVNRDLPKVPFTVEKKGEGCTIDTGAVKLEYAGGAFAPETLAARGRDFAWTYGDAEKGNLYGTKRTLDGVKDRATLMNGLDNNWGRGGMEKGILSRDGWTIVDDSTAFLFVPTDDHWQNWAAPRSPLEGRKDLYLFAYGHDYKRCLKDYTRVAGKIPLPPKWAFGYWWSRYWLYTDAEVKELATHLREVDVPQDVFILDMEWHETWGIGPAGLDEFGEKIGWTGYTWNKHLFPDPKKLMDWFHARGLKTAANLHPASGVTPREACYPDFCRDYGWTGTNAVPYRMSERKWADSYFKTVLGPIENQGMDFWWIDWQQWPTSKYIPGLNNTFWLNYVFNRHMEMRKNGAERPIIYHRWGGLGSHRYQVGFSGDTAISWKVLEFIPWFTATASNVGYGYWGHDIGGHCMPETKTSGLDGDLYLRWLQSAVFTPIFKTHSTKDANIERRIWKYPNEMFTLREAIRLRYRLAPYIYTAARMAYDKGVSICRPMYYDWPEEDAAYDQHLHELMFGNDILAGTIVCPMDQATRLSPGSFWFPEGTWFDVETGSFIEGGKTVEMQRTAAENPWFVKTGAILPMYPDDVMSLQQADDSKMVLFVTPGADEGTGDLYEDAGTNPDYADTCAWTCFHQRMVGNTLHLGIGARDGTYLGMPASRSWEIRLPNRLPGATAKVNGRIVPTTYIGKDLTLVVTTPALNPNEAAHVEITWPSRADEPLLAGKRGFLHRAAEVGEALKPAYRAIHWAANVPNSYLKLAQLGSMIESAPERAHELLAGFDAARTEFSEEYKAAEEKIGPSVSTLVHTQLGL